MIKKEITHDSREPKEFVDFLRSQLPNFVFTNRLLPAGDYEVNGVAVERKTDEDYIASLRSGRLNNQLASLSYNYDLSYLVIVGNLWRTAFRTQYSRSALVSSLLGSSFKRIVDGRQGQIVTVQLETDFEFALFLRFLTEKEQVRMVRPTRVSLSRDDRLVATLMTVPGWGETLSRRALKVFKTLKDVFLADPREIDMRVYGCGEARARAIRQHLTEVYQDNSNSEGDNR